VLPFVNTLTATTDNIGAYVTRQEIDAFYGGPGLAVLDCKGANLSQIYLCFAKEAGTGRVLDQVPYSTTTTITNSSAASTAISMC
jgi:hypothetical protein